MSKLRSKEFKEFVHFYKPNLASPTLWHKIKKSDKDVGETDRETQT